MRFAYQFSNILGSVYNKGTLLFTPDGNTILSPVGNKISCYDLKNNRNSAVRLEAEYNFSRLTIHPKGTLLLAATEKTQLYVCSLLSGTILHRKDYRAIGPSINVLCFSPDGLYYAVCVANMVMVYITPGVALVGGGRELSPFKIFKTYKAHYDDTVCLSWSQNSKLIAVGSKDLNFKIYNLQDCKNVPPVITVSGHSDIPVECFFANNEFDLDLYTLSRNNQLCIWEAGLKSEDLEGGDPENPLRYQKKSRVFFNEHLKNSQNISPTLTSAAYHSKGGLLVTGFSNGAFLLHDLPEFNLIHSLELSTTGSIDSLAINSTADWIAIGSGIGSGDRSQLKKDTSSQSQLMVWEWQSETFILKQSGTGAGFTNIIESVCYSPDGTTIASGGTDGKIRLWNCFTGFCFVTFSEEHKGPVTALQFVTNKGGKVLVSASLDGTVRAFDLTRYRNFRTLAGPADSKQPQFISLAVDNIGGDFIAAGAQNTFEIFLWSMQTGRLLECLTGHEGPVSGVAFSNHANLLVSCSWDGTARVWNLFEGAKCTREVLSLGGDALALAFRPDGNQIAISTINGNICFFDPHTAEMMGVPIEGGKDLGMSQSEGDLIKDHEKYFTCLCYSVDGSYIVAGGKSKHVLLYHVQEKILVRNFTICWNYSMDGLFDYISKRKTLEFGFNLELLKNRHEGSQYAPIALPGVKKGDFSERQVNPLIQVTSIQFSPTMRSFVSATTEGILIYSLDTVNQFNPYQLDTSITPKSVINALRNGEYHTALLHALKLNEKQLIVKVIESIPSDSIGLISKNTPLDYVERCLHHIAVELESTRRLELYLSWTNTLLKQHGVLLKSSRSKSLLAVLRLLQRNLSNHFDSIGKVCDSNKFLLKFLQKACKNSESTQNSDEEPMEV